jgi:Flp pilus assembly protein CpaB
MSIRGYKTLSPGNSDEVNIIRAQSMNHSRFLVIGPLALALCAFVTAGVHHILHIRTKDSETSRVDVVVATHDLGPEERIGEEDIKIAIAKLQRNDFPLACFRDKSLVVGHRVILPISEGNIICPSDLATKDEKNFTWPEMRAVSVTVGEIVGTTDFPEAGTHVDILLTRTLNGGRERTTTVLKNACEIAVAEGPSTGGLRQSVSVVLLLSPDHALKVAQGRRRGEIRLSVLFGLPNCL